MYSLYRAWLSMGNHLPPVPVPPPIPMDSAPLNLTSTSTSTSSAPDVTLQVGPTMTTFSAHRNVLVAHSGFFKAALTGPLNGPILVPNVNVDEFSSLLTFMYTGYLDLNIGNIYNTLLATHMLHMPRALEICRGFLMQHQQPGFENPNTNIIKPIASKAVVQLGTVAAPEQFQLPSSSSFVKSENTVFQKIASKKKEDDKKVSAAKSNATITSGGSNNNNNNNSKVIIDIACCDGPVRFHRVVNSNYGLTPSEEEAKNTTSFYEPNKSKNTDALNKIMNKNIRERDENNGVFTCHHCNHTFKSQYCYQKHARRHLNPVDAKSSTGTAPPVATTSTAKREVKLLDMNVQYYPCKTCGSKFPSYYFVHKHRKLWHADEMADNTNKNNEIVQVKSTSTAKPDEIAEDTTSSSIIDVEETNDN